MTTEHAPHPQLGAQLAYLFKRSVVDLERLHAQHLAPLGITGRELGLLLLLQARDPESQQQTAGRLGIDRTSMVGLVDALESKDLVARRADPTDRRRNVLELTTRGQATLVEAIEASDRAERQLLTPLDDTEAAQLRTLLTRLTEHPAHP